MASMQNAARVSVKSVPNELCADSLSDGTAPLDAAFEETVQVFDRVYQEYALTNGTYFAPIDEVRRTRPGDINLA